MDLSLTKETSPFPAASWLNPEDGVASREGIGNRKWEFVSVLSLGV